jgi:hypothetical protein
MTEWVVVVALGTSVLTFILWGITTYLTFIRNRPKLSVKVPRYVERNDEWDIYVYNEGNRATRMLEQFTCIELQDGKVKISKNGGFRPENRKVYFNANPGEYHHFYTKYRDIQLKYTGYEDTFLEKIQLGMRAKMFLSIKYDNGRKTKLYKKYIKLDQADVNLFIQEKFKDKKIYLRKEEDEEEFINYNLQIELADQNDT